MVNANKIPQRDFVTNEFNERILSFTVEIYERLKKDKQATRRFFHDNLTANKVSYLQIIGWSRKVHLPNWIYDETFTSSLRVKKLMLRGRGLWDTCHCPRNFSIRGDLLDTITEENTTNIEHLYIMRTFRISACALLDLISRSPKLKTVAFYGTLIKAEHAEAFKSVRFTSDLDKFIWPWADKKRDLPTIKLIARRNDKIKTFYSNAVTTCDLLASDLLSGLRNLSIMFNENWTCKPGSIKRAARYLKKIQYLSCASDLEALELRTFDLELDDDSSSSNEDETKKTTHKDIKALFENFQLTFWEQVAKMKRLKYLAVYGAWELEKVCRELARHGLQIEFFKTNLTPTNMIASVDARDDCGIILSMVESIRQLRQLTKLRSIHFKNHENLNGIDRETVLALKELIDLIWNFAIRSTFTPEVDDLLSSILKRGYQQGRFYKLGVHVEAVDVTQANIYFETVLKFSPTSNLSSQLNSIVESECKKIFNNSIYSTYHIWGISLAGSQRDRSSYDQLKQTWTNYEDTFYPIEMYI